ncbi:phosphotransferase [Streptomyces sp. NPDC088725]|uniref:phosphotransferase n=1 Tax=Streptomyces sp. NPDC088725 TaxID=3365873 RepID=UPI0037FA9E4C
MTVSVVRTLTRAARAAAHRELPPPHCPACARDGRESRDDPGGREAAVLADRRDGTVVRHGSAVAKAHADDTDPHAHRARTAVAAHPLLTGVLLPPLPPPQSDEDAPGDDAPREGGPGRLVTLWPYGAPVDPDHPDAAPWEQAGALAARLHSVPLAALPGPLPAMRGPAKAARALARMRAAVAGGRRPAAVVPVERAWARLPAWARDEARSPAAAGPDEAVTLCHGDLHLGQLVRHPAPEGPWLLIDVDDLGIGAPAWDLARPAAWYAAGLLPEEAWQRFLAGYRSAHGPAVPAEGDPWPRLDVAARALTVQTAALAIARSAAEDRDVDEAEQLMIDACGRIAALATELACDASS